MISSLSPPLLIFFETLILLNRESSSLIVKAHRVIFVDRISPFSGHYKSEEGLKKLMKVSKVMAMYSGGLQMLI